MPSKPTKFVDEPQALLCPICKKIFHEPVISIKCGHTFCRLCIEELIRDGSTCPLDEQECDSGQLVLNRAVMGQIEDLPVYCCHGLISLDGGRTYEQDPAGCKEVIRFGKREEHESKCHFAVVQCPVGGEQCGILRQHQLEKHMTACTMVPCPFIDFGCYFRGTSAEVADHKSKCTYKDESQLLAITMKELKAVKASNMELQQSLVKAVKAIDKLSAEKATMGSQLEQQALTITTLTSRMDKLETELEAFKSVRLRPSTRHHTGDTTPRYNRRTSANGTKRWSSESITSITSLTPETNRGPFVWQMPFTVKCIGTFRGHKGTIWSMVTYADRLYSSSSDGSIKLWDVADLRRGCLKTVHAHKDCAMCLAVGRGVLYSAGTDLCLRSWHLDTLEEVGIVQCAHDEMISAMVCSKEYVFTSSSGCIKVWDPITLKEVHRINGISQSKVRSLVYNKRKATPRFYLAAVEKFLHGCEIKSGSGLGRGYDWPTGNVVQDLDCLYSCSFNKIHIWKASDNFALVQAMETQYGAIYSLAITKKYIITGTHNQNIQVYDISSLKHVCTLSGHIGIVTVLKVTESIYGQYMFSGSSDTTVQVWNLENMLPIMALQRHERAVQSMALWQDSVFTGSEDTEIKVFRHFKL